MPGVFDQAKSPTPTIVAQTRVQFQTNSFRTPKKERKFI
jgi:hypothetical protein